jgi:hypothetical protein
MHNKVDNVCRICNKILKSVSGLGRHTKLTHKITPKEYYKKYFMVEHENECKICKKETSFIKFSNPFSVYCSTKCVHRDPQTKVKTRDTHFDRTGYNHNTENPENEKKRKETCLKKYGVDSPSKSEEVKNKIKKTCLEKFGVEHSFQSENNKIKSKETCLKKYGVEYTSQNPEIMGRIQKTNHLNRVKQFTQYIPSNYKIIEYIMGDEVVLECDKHHIFTCQKQLIHKRIKANHICCTTCQPLNSFSPTCSSYEKELYEFIKEYYEGEIITNSKKIIPPLELDIYLPDRHLAFEFNGLYWHSELSFK